MRLLLDEDVRLKELWQSIKKEIIMGAPMIEDERLYSFFDEFKANMDADVDTSKGLYLQEKHN